MCIKQVFMDSINTEQDSIPVGCIPPASQPYVFWWSLLDVSTGGWGGGGVGPQVNKFEQVSSDDHQISVAGKDGSRSPGMMSGEGVPFHGTYPMMHMMYLPPLP